MFSLAGELHVIWFGGVVITCNYMYDVITLQLVFEVTLSTHAPYPVLSPILAYPILSIPCNAVLAQVN